MKKNLTLFSLADAQKSCSRFSLLCAVFATGLSLPLATGWAASWPTPVLINTSPDLQQAVSTLNQTIIDYSNDPSQANLDALTAAETQYRAQVAIASPAAVLAITSNDSIVPPRLVISTARAASIQAGNAAELLIQNFSNPGGGAIALANGAALNLSAQAGGQLVFRSNSSNNGGVINNNNSALSITGSRFEENSATNNGGAIVNNNNGRLSITGSTFEGNSANNDGGAIINNNGRLSIVNSTFSSNTAAVSGGAVRMFSNSPASITNSVFNDNQAGESGGAIASLNSVLNITGSIFSGNNTTLSGGYGGAIDATISTTNIIDTTFTGNSATYAGALRSSGSTVNISNSSFTNNQAQLGGAISNERSTLNLIDTTFTDNNAVYAGALRNIFNSTANISNSSFANNQASEEGGAIANTTSSTLNIIDTNFTDNSAGLDGGAIYLSNGLANFTVSTGRTMLFSGNTANGQASSIAIANPDSINSALNVNVIGNGLLDMHDPMGTESQPNTGSIAIVKTGAGVWALGGANDFASTGSGLTDFSVLAGRLYLYANNELPNLTAGTIQLGGADSSFRLGSGAELVGGGDNRIETAGTIIFADGSTLRGGNAAIALGGDDPSRYESGGATSLSLSAAGGVVLEGEVQVAALSSGDTFTINGILEGTGGLNKTGAGLAILTGANAYQGPTNVNMGILRINGNQALATGVTTVNAGATLEGNGTLGGNVLVGNGGSISPGNGTNSIATLSILGNYSQAAGSFYETDINAQGESDLILVQGNANINGGTVHTTGMYALNTRYTVVEAQQGVNGVYNALTHNNAPAQSLPYLVLQLIYDANHVYLDALRNEVPFSFPAKTVNQRNTANGVESMGTANPVYNAVVNVANYIEALLAFDALSGEGYSSALALMMEESRYIREATLNRLHQSFAKPASNLTLASWNPLNAKAIDLKKDWEWWMQGYGAWGKLDGDGNAAKVDRSNRGFFLGADHWLGEAARLGIVGGYSRSDLNLDARRTSGKLDNYTLGVYGGASLQQLAFRAGAAYTKHEVDMSRAVQFSGFSNLLNSDYNAHTAQVFAEAGYTLSARRFSFEPFAGLAYVDVDASRWMETGGDAALTGKGSLSTTYSTLGLREEGLFYRGERVLVDEQISLGWRHAYNNLTPQATMAFLAGGLPFEIYGTPIAQDALMVDAGLSWYTLPRNLNLRLAYNGQLASQATDHAVTARLAWRMD